MGTRGALGFRLNKKDYVSYNHWDSYPSGLGNDVVNALKTLTEGSLKDLKEQVGKIRLIDMETPPTKEDIELCENMGTVDLTVSESSTSDWYCLLRKTQGSPLKMAELGIMSDDQEFLKCFSCQYAYIINLDTNDLEIYQGYQTTRGTGRYAKGSKKDKDGFYPVSLVITFSILNIPEDWLDVVDDLMGITACR